MDKSMCSDKKPFSKDLLKLDAQATTQAICERLSQDIFQKLKKRGAVVGVSGGIDSAVSLALAARALGPKKVVALLLPEKDSTSTSANLARSVAKQFGVTSVVLEEMSPSLEGFRCYQRRNEAIKRAFPDFDPEKHSVKIVLPGDMLDREGLNVYSLAIVSESGETQILRLKLPDFLQIMAASNFKQRSRMCMLYYHAELRNFAVVGTPNRHEHAQGFFVKYGDGGIDVMPIAHLYKCQVYQLGKYLGVPQTIIERTPTAETYSAEATQTEFFFQLDFERLDIICYGLDHRYPPEEVAAELGLTAEQVGRAYRNIERKMATTNYLRMPPLKDYPVVGKI